MSHDAVAVLTVNADCRLMSATAIIEELSGFSNVPDMIATTVLGGGL
jgi:hypothetical protein